MVGLVNDFFLFVLPLLLIQSVNNATIGTNNLVTNEVEPLTPL